MTKLDICKQALIQLGEFNPISSVDTADTLTPTEYALAHNFDTARMKVLARYGWNFAKKKIESCGNCREVQLPYDFIRIHELVGLREPYPKYEIIGNTLECPDGFSRITYIRDIDDIELWPSHVIPALVLRLAAECAVTITSQLNKKQLAEDGYEREIAAATRIDANNYRERAGKGENPIAEAMTEGGC